MEELVQLLDTPEVAEVEQVPLVEMDQLEVQVEEQAQVVME
tara:strand:- start:272 stop:394 length:123 start_codon:yes stop_codon:yes gene_type:complete